MTTLTADEIRSRVETDWNRIVKVLAERSRCGRSPPRASPPNK